MQIANAAFTSELLYHTPPGSPQLAVLKSSKVRIHQLSFSPAALWDIRRSRTHPFVANTVYRVVCFTYTFVFALSPLCLVSYF